MCEAHEQRARHGKCLDTPIRPKTKGGGEWSNGYGYIVKTTTRGLMMKHRWVMEQHIGRQLFKNETVHHMNGDRKDNRIENLELWSSAHPPGQRVVDKLKWARELIDTYKEVRL